MPQILYSFFDEYDFSGKTIIPFNSHNGSRFSGTIETIQELEPNTLVIIDGFAVNERDVPDAKKDIDLWLEELGYEKRISDFIKKIKKRRVTYEYLIYECESKQGRQYCKTGKRIIIKCGV